MKIKIRKSTYTEKKYFLYLSIYELKLYIFGTWICHHNCLFSPLHTSMTFSQINTLEFKLESSFTTTHIAAHFPPQIYSFSRSLLYSIKLGHCAVKKFFSNTPKRELCVLIRRPHKGRISEICRANRIMFRKRKLYIHVLPSESLSGKLSGGGKPVIKDLQVQTSSAYFYELTYCWCTEIRKKIRLSHTSNVREDKRVARTQNTIQFTSLHRLF